MYWTPLEEPDGALWCTSFVACKLWRTTSRRSHLSAGMKYQLQMPKIVTEPKMTQAKLNVSAVVGKKNGEIWV